MDQRFSLQAFSARLQQAFQAPLPSRVGSTLELAYEAHAEQLRDADRKQDRLPYIVHPIGTALLCIQYYSHVKGLTDDLETIICVALAHDLLEDTRVPASRVEAVAGRGVRLCVQALTKPTSVSAPRSLEQRNQQFAASIVQAGPTAVLVKISDSLHNLSRPRHTPARLLSKLISKARRHYLPMLQQCDLGPALRAAYESAIAEADGYLSKVAQGPDGRQHPSLEAALAKCVGAARGKAPELHDICAALRDLCGLQAVSVWSLDARASNRLDLLLACGPVPFPSQLESHETFSRPQIISTTLGLPTAEAGADAIAVPLSLSPGRRLLFALYPSAPDDPAWLSPETAGVMVQTLAQRLVQSQEDQRVELAAAAARLGMKMDLGLAVRIGATPGDLADLAVWHARCLQAITRLRHLIADFFLARPGEVPLGELAMVESRVKAVDSTLSRFIRSPGREWPCFAQLEDIAGVRVVLPTQAGVECIDRFLRSQEVAKWGVRLSCQVDSPRRDYQRQPTIGGYRSLHLILDVDTAISDLGEVAVPCEVQLRTMLQHTWAAISHATTYKSTKARKKHDAKLKQMAQALLECDELAQEIVEESRRDADR